MLQSEWTKDLLLHLHYKDDVEPELACQVSGRCLCHGCPMATPGLVGEKASLPSIFRVGQRIFRDHGRPRPTTQTASHSGHALTCSSIQVKPHNA